MVVCKSPPLPVQASKQIGADVRCFSAMVSSCVRYSTLFFQHEDVTCELSILFTYVWAFDPIFAFMKDEPAKDDL